MVRIRPPSTHYPLRLPEDVAEEIRRLATAHERSFNAEIVWALRQYLIKQSHEE